MGRRRRGRDEEEAEINITPMLDVVFIMLIFFIVTTAFIRETGIDPSRPLAETAGPQARGNILIALSAADEIWYDNRQLQLGDVRTAIERAVAENPESSVVIVADEHASSGFMVDLMDQVRLSGVSHIAVAAEHP